MAGGAWARRARGGALCARSAARARIAALWLGGFLTEDRRGRAEHSGGHRSNARGDGAHRRHFARSAPGSAERGARRDPGRAGPRRHGSGGAGSCTTGSIRASGAATDAAVARGGRRCAERGQEQFGQRPGRLPAQHRGGDARHDARCGDDAPRAGRLVDRVGGHGRSAAGRRGAGGAGHPSGKGDGRRRRSGPLGARRLRAGRLARRRDRVGAVRPQQDGPAGSLGRAAERTDRGGIGADGRGIAGLVRGSGSPACFRSAAARRGGAIHTEIVRGRCRGGATLLAEGDARERDGL